MSAYFTDPGLGHSQPAAAAGTPSDGLARQWAALREAAAVVATLAGLPQDAAVADQLALPANLHLAPERRRLMIEQTVGDLVAIMEPGLAALLAVHEQGGQTAVAAAALWQEFVAARRALALLVPPTA